MVIIGDAHARQWQKIFFSKTIINRMINEATVISERARANSIIINALCRASARSARAR